MSSSSSTAGGHGLSSTSTPATDISPPGSPDFVLPPPTPEMLRRRAQSDRASSEIGSRMLKGWAMLSDECTNDDCWAIPLVRPPRARPGAQPDPRKECVICGTVYVTNEDGQLVAQSAPATRASTGPSQTDNRPIRVADVQPSVHEDTYPPAVIRVSSSVYDTPHPPIIIQPTPIQPTITQPTIIQAPPMFGPTPCLLPTSQPSQETPFTSAAEALGSTLDLLSQRLVQTSRAANMDIKQVKETAEVMDTVMRALGTARQFGKNA